MDLDRYERVGCEGELFDQAFISSTLLIDELVGRALALDLMRPSALESYILDSSQFNLSNIISLGSTVKILS